MLVSLGQLEDALEADSVLGADPLTLSAEDAAVHLCDEVLLRFALGIQGAVLALDEVEDLGGAVTDAHVAANAHLVVPDQPPAETLRRLKPVEWIEHSRRLGEKVRQQLFDHDTKAAGHDTSPYIVPTITM